MSDLHCPFHSRECLDLAVAVGKDIDKSQGLNQIILNGDIADCYGLSQHGPKSPLVIDSFYDEIHETRKVLREIRSAFPKTEIIYICGNHEHRLARFIDKVPEMAGILTVAELLCLDDLKIKYVDYGPGQSFQVLDTNLIARHEGLSNGVNCARASLIKSGCSVIFGHTHRMQSAHCNSMNGEIKCGYSIGHMANPEGNKEIFSYIKGFYDWQQGFAVVTSIDKQFYVDPILITNNNGKYRCLYNGYLYESR